MKKIIGILGIAVIAVTMFFSANTVNGSTTDTSLVSLIAVNTANAEVVQAVGCHYSGFFSDTCTHNGWTIYKCYNSMFGYTCYYNNGI